MEMQTHAGGPGDWFWPHTQLHFEFNGKSCIVIVPETVAPGRPWVWRARFLGAFPYVDQDLLDRGYHVVFIDTANMFGAPAAMDIWDAFYGFVTGEFKLAPKMTLEGFSRGGLFVYNWAARNPQKVNCIYADAPVCDIRSWPGGMGRCPGDAVLWKKCMELYGLTEETAKNFNKNPIDILGPIAAANIPILHVCGDADEAVAIEEHTYVLVERYRALGGDIKLIIKPGVKHHPHSLEDPREIVNFIVENS